MRLPFELDPQIIHHIIYSQAGSIGKAVIELLMNAVDAQASEVQLSLTRDGFECRDNGNGFASREDVLRYFGRFGTPHKEGDATYGRFRLGRGQIMAHASTVWQSKAWTMTVDTRGLQAQQAIAEEQRQEAEEQRRFDAEWNSQSDDAWQVDTAEQEVMEAQERLRIAAVLQVPPETIVDDPLYWMMGEDEAAIRQYWAEKPWEQVQMARYSDDAAALIKPGETAWLLERNTVAAGFMRVEDYLKWRSEQEDLC